MPLSKAHKEAKLNELRNIRSLYAEKVSVAMKLIDPEYLSSESAKTSFKNRVLYPYGEDTDPYVKPHNNESTDSEKNKNQKKEDVSQNKKRLGKYLDRYVHYTEEDKANIIGVSHTAIHKIENKLSYIDPFYLECYSLIFNVSPLYFVGKVDHPDKYSLDDLVEGMVFIEPKIVSMCQMIVMNLYKSDIGKELLNDFYRISNIKSPITFTVRQRINDLFDSIPIIENDLNDLKTEDIEKLDVKEEFNQFLLRTNFKPADEENNTAGYTSILLSTMGELDYELIKKMYVISKNDKIYQMIHICLRDGGFFDNKRAFSKSDEILDK